MGNELINMVLEIAKACAIIAIPIIARRFDAFLVAKEAEAVANKNNIVFNATYQKILEIIHKSVDTTNQTFVDELKKTDKFDKSAWETAYHKTHSLIIRQLDQNMRDFIEATYVDVDTFIETQVESYINEYEF